MGIATMYGGLALSADDEVLSTTHDFFSTEDSLRLLTKRTGAQVKRVTLYDQPWQATVDEMVSRLVAGLTPRTKVVAVTWVHSSTGVRLPIKEISAGRSTAAAACSASTACTASRRSTSTCPTSAATSCPPAPTSGCSARAAPASCGAATGDR